MKKQFYFLSAMLLAIFSSVSSASLIDFYQYGSSDLANKTQFISNIVGNGRDGHRRKISINYNLGSNWTINSAHLWVKAVDDYHGGFCKGWKCKDGHTNGKDRREFARIINIEGHKGNWASKAVNGAKWYDVFDVTSFLLHDKDGIFKALYKSSRGGDFWLRNAKLEIDYTINSVSALPLVEQGAPIGTPIVEPTPATVPVPAAVWLFGSALLALAGLVRRTPVTGIAN